MLFAVIENLSFQQYIKLMEFVDFSRNFDIIIIEYVHNLMYSVKMNKYIIMSI